MIPDADLEVACEAELAYQEGRLRELLADGNLVIRLGSNLFSTYDWLSQFERHKPWPFRLAAARGLIAQAHCLLSDPPSIFNAVLVGPVDGELSDTGTSEREVQSSPPAGGRAAMPAGLVVYLPLGTTFLRLDQVHTANFWGIGFALQTPNASAWLRQGLRTKVVAELSTDLRDLQRIGERFSGREIEGDFDPVGSLHGLRFEHLMLDILNEHAPFAKHARLFEDFLEKTDLRFRHPGLPRRHGARIQVTATSSERWHSRKLDEIRRAEEFVILSPRSLATALESPEASRLVLPEEVGLLRKVFSPNVSSVDEMALGIRDIFQAAMKSPQAHPLGPMAAVPEILRRFLLKFVIRESNRTTATLRKREAELR